MSTLSTFVHVMKSVFDEYKTPSMTECEMLGREIGLPKRVVQVWFQNARAKEKKARLSIYGSSSIGSTANDPESPSKVPDECKLCGVKYNHKFSATSMQEHLFSPLHIETLRVHITSSKSCNESGSSGESFADDSCSTDYSGVTSSLPYTMSSTSTPTTPMMTNFINFSGHHMIGKPDFTKL